MLFITHTLSHLCDDCFGIDSSLSISANYWCQYKYSSVHLEGHSILNTVLLFYRRSYNLCSICFECIWCFINGRDKYSCTFYTGRQSSYFSSYHSSTEKVHLFRWLIMQDYQQEMFISNQVVFHPAHHPVERRDKYQLS